MTSSISSDWPSRRPRPLPPDEAHLYFMRLEGFKEPPPGLYDLLNPAERERCDRYVFMRHRIEFTAARALIRAALSRYSATPPQAFTFDSGEHGKPQLSGPSAAPMLQFNVAHTQGLVVALLALDRQVGVDAELLGRRRNLAQLARRCLSSAEQQALWALPEPLQARRFLIHWTLKEAYLKARGIGLGLPLREITLMADDDPQVLEGPPTDFQLGPGVGDDASRWQIARCQLTEHHVAALAIERALGAAAIQIQEVLP